MYNQSAADEPLRQGEILSSVKYFMYDEATDEVSAAEYEYAVILGQDCDLDRFHSAELESPDLAPVLIFPASPTTDGRENAQLNSTIWAIVKKNDHQRYHVLQTCPTESDAAEQGIPDLLIDFRRFFVAPYSQIIAQITNGSASRRACLRPPYRDHLQFRAVNYLGRIALDPPHEIAATT